MPETFAIYDLTGIGGGTLGICPLPGRNGDAMVDFQTIWNWQPDYLVTLTKAPEFSVPKFDTHCQTATKKWLHLPLADFTSPTSETAGWTAAMTEISQCLSEGGRVLAHCYGGKGRSGMILLRLMILQGEDPDTALARLRAVRPGAVETDDQRFWAVTGTPA